MARGGCGSRCGGRSRRSCRRCGRCIRGLGVCRWSRRGGALAAAVLEVGRVPARALELKAGSRQLLGKGLGTTGRAGRQRSIRDFPQHVLGMTAGATLVCINRHGANAYTREDAKLSIIGIRPILRLPCPPKAQAREPQAACISLYLMARNAKCQSRGLAFHQGGAGKPRCRGACRVHVQRRARRRCIPIPASMTARPISTSAGTPVAGTGSGVNAAATTNS